MNLRREESTQQLPVEGGSTDISLPEAEVVANEVEVKSVGHRHNTSDLGQGIAGGHEDDHEEQATQHGAK